MSRTGRRDRGRKRKGRRYRQYSPNKVQRGDSKKWSPQWSQFQALMASDKSAEKNSPSKDNSELADHLDISALLASKQINEKISRASKKSMAARKPLPLLDQSSSVPSARRTKRSLLEKSAHPSLFSPEYFNQRQLSWKRRRRKNKSV